MKELPELLLKIEMLRSELPEPKSRLSVRNGWRFDSILKDLEFKFLIDYIKNLSRQIVVTEGRDKAAEYKLSAWINGHNQGGYNTVHHHGIATISGVIYLNCPEGSGNLHLRDPRPGASFGKSIVNGGKDYVIQPKAGYAILFPGFLEHWVEPSLSDSRISVAFNLTEDPFV